jgi:hypothetical protein
MCQQIVFDTSSRLKILHQNRDKSSYLQTNINSTILLNINNHKLQNLLVSIVSLLMFTQIKNCFAFIIEFQHSGKWLRPLNTQKKECARKHIEHGFLLVSTVFMFRRSMTFICFD